jgi:hypothetical protein
VLIVSINCGCSFDMDWSLTMKKFLAAAALAASVAVPNAASAATLINGSFEAGPTGNPTTPPGWSTNRPNNVRVVNIFNGYTAVDGTKFAVISNGAQNIATTLFQQFEMTAGEIIRFAVAFYTEESTVGNSNFFNDNGSLFTINIDGGGTPSTLFQSSVNAIGSGQGTPWTFVSFTAPNTGLYQVTARVANIGDGVVPSYLLLDAVPEPGTWMLMLLGFGAIGFSMRRRKNVRVSFA